MGIATVHSHHLDWIPPRDLVRIVRAMIEDRDDLGRRQALREDRLDRLGEEPAVIVADDHDGT